MNFHGLTCGIRDEYVLSYDGTFSLGFGAGISFVYGEHNAGFTIGVGISGTWGFSAPITISRNRGGGQQKL